MTPSSMPCAAQCDASNHNENDLARAKLLLSAGNVTCALCRGKQTLLSNKRGVVPMLSWIDSGLVTEHYAAADKIVGKAAAMLFLLAGVTAVYGQVMSRTALDYLTQHGIFAAYGALADTIRNRAGTGQCPMELAVAALDDPEAAFHAIVETRKRMLSI